MSWCPAPEHPSTTLKPTLKTASSSMSRVSRESKKPTPLVPTNSRPARSGVAGNPTLWPRTPTRRRLPRGGSLFKKIKTCTVFLSNYGNTSGSLGQREMLWEHKPQASVSTAFSSSPKLSTKNENTATKKRKITCLL